MSNSLNIPLTDELKKFIQQQAGNGTFYSTPSEYVRDLIRQDRDRKEANRIRHSILAGYQDAIEGRTSEFSGNLLSDIKKFQKGK